MSVRTCKHSELSDVVDGCPSCSPTVIMTAPTDTDTAALPAADETTVALTLDEEHTVRLDTAPSHSDDPPTVQFAPAVPRQRGPLPDAALTDLRAARRLDVGAPPPQAVAPAVERIIVPQLPSLASAEELAALRLRAPDGEDDESGPHVARILVIFALALAIASVAGYLLAVMLSDDIQAFFDSVVRQS